MTTQEDIDRAFEEGKLQTNHERNLSDLEKRVTRIEETTAVWRSRMMKAGIGVLGLALSQTQPGSDLIVTMVAIFTGVGK